MKEHQLYRLLESHEFTQDGDQLVASVGSGRIELIPTDRKEQADKSFILRPVPSGWRRWDEVKPTEADGDAFGMVYVSYLSKNDDGTIEELIPWDEGDWDGFSEIHWHPLPRLPELKKPEPEPLDDRARFELEIKGRICSLDFGRRDNGDYEDWGTHTAWEAWQAATAQKEVPV